MAAEAQLTPMMAQYRRIKGELPKDALLLFRLGDFYEMFFEDAQAGAQLLNVALTTRNGVPMCGMPFHAANGYIAPHPQGRAQGRHLRPDGRRAARPAGEARGHANPFARHAFRRADARGGAEQFPRRRLSVAEKPSAWRWWT